jgi:hypothetical protein
VCRKDPRTTHLFTGVLLLLRLLRSENCSTIFTSSYQNEEPTHAHMHGQKENLEKFPKIHAHTDTDVPISISKYCDSNRQFSYQHTVGLVVLVWKFIRLSDEMVDNCWMEHAPVLVGASVRKNFHGNFLFSPNHERTVFFCRFVGWEIMNFWDFPKRTTDAAGWVL